MSLGNFVMRTCTCTNLDSTVQPTTHLGYMLYVLLLGYKPVQHITVLNTVSNFNTMVSIIILCYNLKGPLSLTKTSLCGTYMFIKIHTVLRHGSAAQCLLGLWVRIPPGAWMPVSCECCVLSGRGLCVGTITHSQESY